MKCGEFCFTARPRRGRSRGQRKPKRRSSRGSEGPRETGPIFVCLCGPTGTRNQVQAARLIRAFGTHGTRRTNVTWLGPPNAGELDVSLDAESLDDAAQHRFDGARLRDR
jgi:hypothetical protein